MKPNELRIGNLINYKGIVVPATMIGEYGIQSKTKDRTINAKFAFFDLDYISLTEDWLFNFGFIKDGDYFSFGNLHYHLPTGSIYVGNDHVSSGHDDAKIEFVHQLQNLYFALTGKELTLKEN